MTGPQRQRMKLLVNERRRAEFSEERLRASETQLWHEYRHDLISLKWQLGRMRKQRDMWRCRALQWAKEARGT